MGLAAFALALSGFAVLALGMARHHRQVFGRDPRVATSLASRIAGAALLAASLAASCDSWAR